jgi:hypothetical protein
MNPRNLLCCQMGIKLWMTCNTAVITYVRGYVPGASVCEFIFEKVRLLTVVYIKTCISDTLIKRTLIGKFPGSRHKRILGKWSTSRPGLFIPGLEPPYPLHRWLCGPHSRSGRFWGREKSLARAGIQTPARPIHILIAIPTAPFESFIVPTLRIALLPPINGNCWAQKQKRKMRAWLLLSSSKNFVPRMYLSKSW